MASLKAARRALALGPGDAAARQEVALAYLDLGMPYAARSALGDAEVPAELAQRLRHTGRPEVSLAVTGAAESSGVDRLAARTKMELALPQDVGLTVGTGLSQLQQGSSSLQYRIAGGSLAMQRTRVRLGVGGAVYQGEDILLGEIHGWLGMRLGERASVSIGARRRPLTEAAEPLTTGESAFFAAGAGGASDIGAVARRGVDDLALTLQLAPVDAGYMYAEGHGLAVTDGNRGYSLAAGFGLDIVRMAGIEAPIALLVRGDSYFAGYQVQRGEYFSPERFDGHVASGQVRWQAASSATLSAHAGRTFSVGSDAAPGWTAGGGLEWGIGDWKIAARAEYRDELYYSVRRAWLAVTGRL